MVMVVNDKLTARNSGTTPRSGRSNFRRPRSAVLRTHRPHRLEPASNGPANTLDSKKLEHGCGTISAGFPSFLGVGLEEGHVPTLWLLRYKNEPKLLKGPRPRMPKQQRVDPEAWSDVRIYVHANLHMHVQRHMHVDMRMHDLCLYVYIYIFACTYKQSCTNKVYTYANIYIYI